MMEISFKNKVAFAAGASDGIGAAIAKTLARTGAGVGLMARRPEPLQKPEKEINDAGGKAFSITGDVSKPEDIEKAITASVQKFGGLHLAVNNAAISGDFSLLHNQTVESWRKVMSVNLDSIFYGMKYETAAMLNSAFTTTKHGFAGLTKTAAKDYAKMNIRVNSVKLYAYRNVSYLN